MGGTRFLFAQDGRLKRLKVIHGILGFRTQAVRESLRQPLEIFLSAHAGPASRSTRSSTPRLCGCFGRFHSRCVAAGASSVAFALRAATTEPDFPPIAPAP